MSVGNLDTLKLAYKVNVSIICTTLSLPMMPYFYHSCPKTATWCWPVTILLSKTVYKDTTRVFLSVYMHYISLKLQAPWVSEKTD